MNFFPLHLGRNLLSDYVVFLLPNLFLVSVSIFLPLLLTRLTVSYLPLRMESIVFSKKLTCLLVTNSTTSLVSFVCYLIGRCYFTHHLYNIRFAEVCRQCLAYEIPKLSLGCFQVTRFLFTLSNFSFNTLSLFDMSAVSSRAF